jgi:hypothetical protein
MTLIRIAAFLVSALFAAVGLALSTVLEFQEAVIAAASLTTLGVLAGILCYVTLAEVSEARHKLRALERLRD